MLTAIFTDIHANREALDACLADADRRGAEKFAFLGDLVGYGADPAYVVDRIAQFHAAGALVVKGNHDAAVALAQDSMNGYARTALDWTRGKLDNAQKDFLFGLPLTAECGETLLVHAEASNPPSWTYISRGSDAERSLQATPQRIVFSGHIHRPHLYHMSPHKPASCFVPTPGVPILLAKSHKWQAILGSVGQPRDEIPTAAYVLYDARSATLTFQRVAYDIERAARKIKAAGLPALLSARLYIGR